jgi:hypothetical protein
MRLELHYTDDLTKLEASQTELAAHFPMAYAIITFNLVSYENKLLRSKHSPFNFRRRHLFIDAFKRKMICSSFLDAVKLWVHQRLFFL